jgi:hypothetical protein
MPASFQAEDPNSLESDFMRFRAFASTALLIAPLAACAGGTAAPGEMSGPPALAYAVPPGGAATYVQGDTVQMEMDMGGQMMDVTVAMSSTLDLAYSGAGDALQVTATYRDFEITASNPMAGTQRGDESEIDGPVVFTIDRKGAGTLVSGPTIEGVAAQAVSPGAMAAGFFPRLPGRAVTVGETWTDTVTISTQEEAGTNEGTTVYDFTARGDTVVAGRTLLKVTFTMDDERMSQMSQMGADITQDVSGQGDGFYLWDSSRSLIVEQYAEARMRGTMEVSIAPVPFGLDMVVVQHLKLAEGG